MHYYEANFESILCWVLSFYCQNCARLTAHGSRGKQVLKTTCGSKVALLLPPSGQVWNCDEINFKCVESKSSQSLMRLSSHHKLSYRAPNSLCLIFFITGLYTRVQQKCQILIMFCSQPCNCPDTRFCKFPRSLTLRKFIYYVHV